MRKASLAVADNTIGLFSLFIFWGGFTIATSAFNWEACGCMQYLQGGLFSFHVLQLTEQACLLPNQDESRAPCTRFAGGVYVYTSATKLLSRVVLTGKRFSFACYFTGLSLCENWSTGPPQLVTEQYHYLSHYNVNVTTDISPCTFVWMEQVAFLYSWCPFFPIVLFGLYKILRKKWPLPFHSVNFILV